MIYKMTSFILIFVVFIGLLSSTRSPFSVVAFNLDPDSKIIYSRSPHSLFGFSVVGHKDKNSSWIIVGAPEDESVHQGRLGISRPGSVYKCQTTLPYNCEQIPFDTMGNNNISGTAIDDKSRQWFGASVHSSGENGILVACAPRYVYFSLNKQRREPVGTCYTATDSFSKFSEYSPCRTVAWGFHQQGYCQAGFSSAISEDRLFIGAVGAYYAQGQVFSQNLKNRLDYFASQEGPENQDNSYLGYSLATGDFTGTNSVDLAVGVPRGANFTGKVVLYTGRRLFNLHNLTGNQVGSYFGYSLATFDGNGDGLDDLAIGAPLQSSGRIGELSEKYETGRVYVVYQNSAHKFRHWDILDGSEIGSRFGLSLSSLGDINLDGFQDLAIGSPYSYPGSVFIHLGSPTGLSQKPYQVLKPQSSSSTTRLSQGFGFSLSGSRDLDGNGYPDLIVGSPDSNQVFYYKSRPVIRVSGDVFFEAGGGKIQAEVKNCSLISGRPVSCTFVKACLEYTGRGVASELDFKVTVTLDFKKSNNYRMFFMENEHSRTQIEILRLRRKKTSCTRSQVYLLPEVIDKLSPIEVSMSYELHSDSKSSSQLLTPILDPRDVQDKVTDRLVIQKDCGVDNICVPNLKLQFNASTDSYLIGSEEFLTVDVTILNAGEASYESSFYLFLPESVYYKRTSMIFLEEEKEPTSKILCSPPSSSNGFALKCDLGNPMEASTSLSFQIVLKPYFETGKVSAINLQLSVNSSNPENPKDLKDNSATLRIPVIIETELKVRGRSEPQPLNFNVSAYSNLMLDSITNRDSPLTANGDDLDENAIGPEVTHVYQVENKGPSDVLGAEVFILWPSFMGAEESEPLLYLTTQPQIRGKVTCDFVDDVNPLGIKIHKVSHTKLPESFRTPRSAASMAHNSTTADDDSFNSQLDCGLSKCTLIYCSLGPLRKRQFALFRLRSRLWSSTLSQLSVSSGQKTFEISSKLIARVTDLPHGVDPTYLGPSSLRITTVIHAISGGPESASVPAWILALSILAGLIFLAVLSLVLNKMGFFTRKRPGPLNGGSGGGEDSGLSSSGKEERAPLAPYNLHKFQPGDIVL